MKVAIMQPYLFPYIGYFQLLASVDRFVFLDDVSFIKKGWIHRNRILVNGAPHTFTVPLVDASQNRPIRETKIHHPAFEREKLLKTMELAYRKAPQFDTVFPMVEEVFRLECATIAEMAVASILRVCAYAGIAPQITMTSAKYGNAGVKGSERIRDIARREGATTYVNPIGGTELYDEADFARDGIELRFLKSRAVRYPQFKEPFVPWLSMIDVLMFNTTTATRDLLGQCDLVRAVDLPA